MKKIKCPAQPMLWPHLTVLVGANVDDKPDFAAVAWTGIAASNPASITISLQSQRYSLKGIYQNRTFSVNIPSVDLVKETDYCGMVSGADTDKVKDCHFEVFYGSLKTAPLIEQCPINLECEVTHTVNLGSHILIIGRFNEIYLSENCLTGGRPDIDKIKLFAFGPGKYDSLQKVRYFALGEAFADGLSAGLDIKAKATY
jgi:flavin reductase (DIM6/NTAB) family NADH-FMN oxidoreductase RutF